MLIGIKLQTAYRELGGLYHFVCTRIIDDRERRLIHIKADETHNSLDLLGLMNQMLVVHVIFASRIRSMS